MTLEEFYRMVKAILAQNPRWRYGQALFNTLDNIRPDLSEKVRGTNFDPFHAHGEHDPRLVKFGEFLAAHWSL